MMRRFILSFLLLLPFAASAQFATSSLRDLDDSEVVSAMKEHVAYLSSAMLEGRKAGSEGEKEAAKYMSDILSSYGIDLLSDPEGDLFGLRQESGDTLRSRNVIGFIPGYDPVLRDHYIVIGARLDNMGCSDIMVNGEKRQTIYYGANGNASGLAMLAQLARKLKTNSVLLRRSVIIAAFGSSLDMGAGAWYFLNRSFAGADKIDAMINLDMLGTGSSGFYAYTASNRDLDAIITRLSGTLQPVQPKLVSLEPVNSDHRVFYDRQIPAVFFTTGMYPEYNSDRDTASVLEYDDMERELEYIYNFTLDLVNGARPEFREKDERRKKYVKDEDVVPYYECDVKPVFLGSQDPSVFMGKWVYVYLRYPREAVQAGVQGRVLVDFVIDTRGRVTDVKVIKGVSELLDAEAVRVISASPDWKPARVRGKKVKCEMSLYVDFKLERRK
mgnify:FL=1